MTPPAERPGKLLSTLNKNIAIAGSTEKATARAIALCWVLHQIGDLHQPLHVVALYGEKWPDGDKGGNAVFVRAKEGRAVINLHEFWDGLLIGSAKFKSLSNLAIELRLRPEFAKDKLAELKTADHEAWARESYDVAVKLAYLNGKLDMSADEKDGAVLPDGYADHAKAAAERRAVVAGYRLAATLQAIAVKI